MREQRRAHRFPGFIEHLPELRTVLGTGGARVHGREVSLPSWGLQSGGVTGS